jgi:hypothetical protein
MIMQILRKIAFLMVFIPFLSCGPEPEPITPELLFSSGFEGDVALLDPAGTYEIDNFGDYKFIRGTDSETGFSWPITVLGGDYYSGLHYVDDDNGQAVESEIQSVIGHDGNMTRALYNEEHYNTGVTQCPYEILDLTEGDKDLYIKYWIKMDTESFTEPNKWRTFFEWKTKDYAAGDGFRLIAFIYTDENGHPYWSWQGDADPQNPVWEIFNTSVAVPMGEWFLTEFYWHWSEGNDGRALWKVNGQVIGDHRGPTTRNSKPIDFIMLTQIYGNANPKHQWIDDIEIWNTIPY